MKHLKRSIALIAFLHVLLMKTSIAQVFNRPIPAAAFPYEFTITDTTFNGYYFTTPFFLNSTPASALFKSPLPILLDNNGYIALYIPSTNAGNSMFNYFPQQQLFSYLHNASGLFTHRIIDTNFNLIDSLRVSGIPPDGHEFQILPNGNYILTGSNDSIKNMSGDTINGNPGNIATHAIGFVIQEFDAAHNLVFQWNSNDYINPNQCYYQYGYNAANFDYCHGNAVAQDLDGNLLVSFRHLNAIYKINHTTGSVMWILGGKSNQFTFPNDVGFAGQHDVRVLPNGNITLFDNRNFTALPRKSRGVQYVLDTIAHTANLVWQYFDGTGFFSMAMGNVETTTTNLHLINYGFVFRPNVSLSLSDAFSNTISTIRFTDSVMSYRSYIINCPFNLTRPSVTCSMPAGSLILTAPSGHSKYEWSNGNTTQSTTINSAGTYQVWVNDGITMVGSLPLIINDISTFCVSTQIAENTTTEKKLPMETVDVYGRRVNLTEPNQLYIIRYSDNTYKKIVLAE